MKHTARPISIESKLQPNHQYTFVTTIGNSVYSRGRTSDGAPVYAEVKYTPIHFLPTSDASNSDATGYDGTPLVSHMSDSLNDAKAFLDAHSEAFGDIQPEYMMLSDTYGAQDVPFDMDRLYIWDLDIEVDRDPVRGHAPVEDPFNPIVSITVVWTHMGLTGTVVYGTQDYTPKDDETYVKCTDERDLLRHFLADYRSGGDYPDILTGWFIQGFDVPYLVNRCKALFDEDVWTTLSPFNRMQERKAMFYQQEHLNIDIKGIAILDYYELYRKFTFAQQESYKLDHIANVELGQRKINYEEYRSLGRLYREDHQKFIEYNVQDVKLVDALDKKLKLMELVCALAYAAKTNFVDTFKQVRLWDIMIYHKLRAEGKQIPPRKQSRKDEQYAGAHVKDPIVGMHKWVVSFDVASMYPHIIREWNLSPEMLLGTAEEFNIPVPVKTEDKVDQALAQQWDLSALHEQDVCMAVNGAVCRRDAEGFLPNMLKTLYDERIRYKGLMKKAKNALEHETDPEKRKELTKNISAYNNQQQVRKVNLNSAYGAMGSPYFRFYSTALAEGVTVTGQVIIRWVAKDINEYFNKMFKTKTDYIIASDTDSVYIAAEKVAAAYEQSAGKLVTHAQIVDVLNQFCEKRIQPIINKSFTDIATYFNVAVPCLTMVRDIIANKGVWTAKKRYILNVYDAEGVRYDKPKLKMMGIEAIKSSTPAICRDMIKESLKLLMNAQQSDVWEYIIECRKKFFAASFEDVAFPRGVNGIGKYTGTTKGVPIHVRGALAFNDMLTRTKLTNQYELIHEGEKIKFAHLRVPNRFFSHVISAPGFCPPEWEIEKWVDYDMQFDKSFLEPLQTILSCAGWSVKHEPSLFD